jgi:hypothetical protein
MQHKPVPLLIKGADDHGGTLVGIAAVFETSIATATSSVELRSASHWITSTPTPLIWMHEADDPRRYVSDVVEATETDDGLAIKGRFDLDTEFRQVGLPKHQEPQSVRSEHWQNRILRHTYASLCAAAGLKPLEIAWFMGHANVTTTLTVYTHLFADDHADAMAALGALAAPKPSYGVNVIALRG